MESLIKDLVTKRLLRQIGGSSIKCDGDPIVFFGNADAFKRYHFLHGVHDNNDKWNFNSVCSHFLNRYIDGKNGKFTSPNWLHKDLNAIMVLNLDEDEDYDTELFKLTNINDLYVHIIPQIKNECNVVHELNQIIISNKILKLDNKQIIIGIDNEKCTDYINIINNLKDSFYPIHYKIKIIPNYLCMDNIIKLQKNLLNLVGDLNITTEKLEEIDNLMKFTYLNTIDFNTPYQYQDKLNEIKNPNYKKALTKLVGLNNINNEENNLSIIPFIIKTSSIYFAKNFINHYIDIKGNNLGKSIVISKNIDELNELALYFLNNNKQKSLGILNFNNEETDKTKEIIDFNYLNDKNKTNYEQLSSITYNINVPCNIYKKATIINEINQIDIILINFNDILNLLKLHINRPFDITNLFLLSTEIFSSLDMLMINLLLFNNNKSRTVSMIHFYNKIQIPNYSLINHEESYIDQLLLNLDNNKLAEYHIHYDSNEYDINGSIQQSWINFNTPQDNNSNKNTSIDEKSFRKRIDTIIDNNKPIESRDKNYDNTDTYEDNNKNIEKPYDNNDYKFRNIDLSSYIEIEGQFSLFSIFKKMNSLYNKNYKYKNWVNKLIDNEKGIFNNCTIPVIFHNIKKNNEKDLKALQNFPFYQDLLNFGVDKDNHYNVSEATIIIDKLFNFVECGIDLNDINVIVSFPEQKKLLDILLDHLKMDVYVLLIDDLPAIEDKDSWNSLQGPDFIDGDIDNDFHFNDIDYNSKGIKCGDRIINKRPLIVLLSVVIDERIILKSPEYYKSNIDNKLYKSIGFIGNIDQYGKINKFIGSALYVISDSNIGKVDDYLLELIYLSLNFGGNSLNLQNKNWYLSSLIDKSDGENTIEKVLEELELESQSEDLINISNDLLFNVNNKKLANNNKSSILDSFDHINI